MPRAQSQYGEETSGRSRRRIVELAQKKIASRHVVVTEDINRRRRRRRGSSTLVSDPEKQSGRYDRQDVCQDRHEAQSHDVCRDPCQIGRYRVETARLPRGRRAVFVGAEKEGESFDGGGSRRKRKA